MAKRILVVDDDELIQIALNELLTPEGYEVHTVSGGAEAIKRLERYEYDLLILDIIMPEMDGLELCKKVRARETFRETPVVFLSAKSRDEDRDKGIDAGANLFLSKPISPAKLLEIVSDSLLGAESQGTY